LRAGDGLTTGGDVTVRGGNVNTPLIGVNELAFEVGGGVIIAAGNGQIDGGGVNIYGGPSTAGNGGNVEISTDSSTASGNIFLNAGSGPTLGDVAIGDQSTTFIIDTTPVVIHDSYFQITDGDENLIIRADPMNIVEYNGKTILRKVSDYLVPAVDTTDIDDLSDLELTQTAYRLASLQNSLEILVNALSQCQHGLFETVDEFGLPDSCPEFSN